MGWGIRLSTYCEGCHCVISKYIRESDWDFVFEENGTSE